MKKLGIIGGLGPAASSRFYATVTALTKADRDCEHLDIVLISNPKIPDRSAFISGKSGDSPLPGILSAVQSLNAMNADYIAIPCVTAHYFTRQIREASKATVISIIEETVGLLRSMSVTSAAVLATDGTVESGIFHSALEKAGITPVVPDSQDKVMDMIISIKAGNVNHLDNLESVARDCKNKGAQVALLACTELSLIKPQSRFYVDCMEVLAKKSIILCGGEVLD
ncbi:MAG: amino acid racemase [Oscillospiraceae bacterium]|nr:amino acid racemase [Oscillospiraceae bacterium]